MLASHHHQTANFYSIFFLTINSLLTKFYNNYLIIYKQHSQKLSHIKFYNIIRASHEKLISFLKHTNKDQNICLQFFQSYFKQKALAENNVFTNWASGHWHPRWWGGQGQRVGPDLYRVEQHLHHEPFNHQQNQYQYKAYAKLFRFFSAHLHLNKI